MPFFASQWLRAALGAATDLTFPRSCVHCRDLVDGADFDYLCKACARELFLAEPPACLTCGYPFWGELAGPRSCPHCAELDPIFERGKTLFLAKGPGRSLVHEIKYHQGFYVLRDLTRMVRSNTHYRDYFQDSRLVPVPLHPAKERERGYNQSAVIAEALAAAAGGDTQVAPLLQRTRFTQTQTRLNRAERHKNVKNAFALAPDAVLIPDQSYILVDDVFTTGSTLNACAAVLRAAGADSVKVLTLGHG